MQFRVRWARPKEHTFPRRYLMIVDPAGNEIVIDSGSRAQLDNLRRVLADAMGIEADPLREQRYPAKPPRCRGKRHLSKGGVAIVFPPRRTWVIALAGAIFGAGIIVVLQKVIGPPKFSNEPAINVGWLTVQVLLGIGFFAPLFWGIGCGAGKTTTLGGGCGVIVLCESGIRPCLVEWKMDEVWELRAQGEGKCASLAIEPVARPGRADARWGAARGDRVGSAFSEGGADATGNHGDRYRLVLRLKLRIDDLSAAPRCLAWRSR